MAAGAVALKKSGDGQGLISLQLPSFLGGPVDNAVPGNRVPGQHPKAGACRVGFGFLFRRRASFQAPGDNRVPVNRIRGAPIIVAAVQSCRLGPRGVAACPKPGMLSAAFGFCFRAANSRRRPASHYTATGEHQKVYFMAAEE